MEKEVKSLFNDAERLYEESIKEMKVNLRNSSEKAWAATVKSTAALLIAKEKAKEWKDVKYAGPRRVLLEKLELEDKEVENLRIYKRYCTISDSLHGACFYEGICEPAEGIKRRIVKTKDYIEDVKRLANISYST